LVPNSSFEDTISNKCFAQMGVTNPIIGPYYFTKNWGTYQFQSPDYYNTCANSSTFVPYPNPASIPHNCDGYQLARTGNAYVGIIAYELSHLPDSSNITLELAVVKLKQPLKANFCYYGEFYMSFSNINAISINQMGMLFTTTDLTNSPYVIDNSIPYQIQWDTTKCFTDTLNWVKISGTFVAQGGEQYLTIGNIRDGAHLKKQFVNTTFTTTCGIGNPHQIVCVFIDDVSLYELPAPQLQSSYVICPTSDSLVIGDTARIQTRYQWYANGLAIDTTSYIKIKPNQTTIYVLHTTNCGTNTQTVVVTYSTNCEPIVIIEPTIPNVFTPNGDNINDTFTFKINGTFTDFRIYNRWGLEIHQSTISHQQSTILWDGRTTSGEACSEGVYFYTLVYKDNKGDTQKKNGYVTLIR
jgi:gliding motility-associated-like protein